MTLWPENEGIVVVPLEGQASCPRTEPLVAASAAYKGYSEFPHIQNCRWRTGPRCAIIGHCRRILGRRGRGRPAIKLKSSKNKGKIKRTVSIKQISRKNQEEIKKASGISGNLTELHKIAVNRKKLQRIAANFK